jgi:heme-degrading monooxygenase HmoA
MPHVLIQHQVARYEVFEQVFQDDEARRQRSGSKGGRLFRNVDDPNNIIVLFEWDTVDRAKAFANSYELREAVEWATDATPPRVMVLEEILRTSA